MPGLFGIFFDILGPVIILVAIGYVVGRQLGLDPAPLAKLAYWVIGPAFIFDSLANAGLSSDALARIAGASATGFIISGVVALIISARLSPDRRAAILTTGTWGNVGNFGVAIATFTFDETILPYAAVCLVVINTMGLFVGIASARGGLGGIGHALTRPMTVVIAPALVVNFTGVTLPPIVDRPVGLLAGAIIPVMLITLGLQLQRMGRPVIDLDLARSLFAKLIVQPLVVIPVCGLFGLSADAAGAVILQAAMPAAVFTSVLAIEQDTRPAQTATIVMAGTLASIATLPFFIAYVG